MHEHSLDRLRRILTELRRPLIAISGGLDSRFLAHVAHLSRNNGVTPLLAHCRGPHVPERETASAEAFAASRGLALHMLDFNPLDLPEVRANDHRRCYHCKSALFSALAALRDRLWPDDPPPLCDGTNASDLGLYRPGLQALAELGIRSPAAEAGLDKPGLRQAARALGLENPEQPARPCLLTRFVYDLAPTTEALLAAGRAEAGLSDLLGEQENFRLRLFPPDPAGAAGRLPFTAELHLEREPLPHETASARALIEAQGFYCRTVCVPDRPIGAYDAAVGLETKTPEPGAPAAGAPQA